MQIDVFVTILEDDSLDFGLMGCITTAAGCALASAGLEMNGLVVGVALVGSDVFAWHPLTPTLGYSIR